MTDIVGTPRLVRIVAPHFVAGLETDGKVRRAAPILNYMVGWNDDRVRQYVRHKGWRASVVEGHPHTRTLVTDDPESNSLPSHEPNPDS